MSFERRLACTLLLLLSTTPIVMGMLPDNPRGLIAPFLVVVATAATLLVVYDRLVGTICAGVSSLAMVFFVFHQGLAETLMLLSVVPASVLIVGGATWIASTALAIGFVGSLLIAPDLAHGPFSLATFADGVGWLTILGWTAVMGFTLNRTRAVNSRVSLLEETADTLDQSIARDTMELRAIARIIADPSLAPVVRGQGLTHQRLNMATQLPDGRILLALLEGDMVATLTAGWLLRASALGGQTDPAALHHLLRVHGDEIIEPEQVAWVALLTPDTNHLEFSQSITGARFRPGKFRFDEPVSRGISRKTIELRMEVHPLPERRFDTSFPWMIAGMAIGFGVLLLLTTLVGALWSPLLVAALCGVAFYLDLRTRALRSLLARAEAAIEDRIDCRDDLHFGLARLHGTLLPYETEHPFVTALAHRLRGEVLGGTFADVLKTSDDTLLVIAGEIAGQGVAAAFLALSAQHALRAHLRSSWAGPTSWETAENVTSGIVAREATSLFFPLRVELGCVCVNADRTFQGTGYLKQITVYDHGDRLTSPSQSGELTDERYLYITPANARPGPEDLAPALDRFEANERIADTIESDEWTPGVDALGSLFSLVFDGVEAPAHGTIIEIAPREAAPTFLEDGVDTLFTVVDANDQDNDAA